MAIPNYNNYGNYGYQPQYQVYQPQYQHPTQQFQPLSQQFRQQAPAMAGRVVNAFEEITANDVPMDSPFAIFYKADGSEIQVRGWTSQGTIATKAYKVVDDTNPNKNTAEQENSLYEPLRALGDNFNERFDRLEQMLVPKTRKKVDSDEQ